MPGNPLLDQLLAPAPPVFHAVAVPARCAGCGDPSRGADEPFRRLPAGPPLCPLCQLGYTAAWEPGQVRLALLPEFAQGALTALVSHLTLQLMAGQRDNTAPTLAGLRQNPLLSALQARAMATHRALPFTASPGVFRQTLLALPEPRRTALLAELAGLRYLPEPHHETVARWFRHRLHAVPPTRSAA